MDPGTTEEERHYLGDSVFFNGNTCTNEEKVHIKLEKKEERNVRKTFFPPFSRFSSVRIAFDSLNLFPIFSKSNQYYFCTTVSLILSFPDEFLYFTYGL